MTPSRQKLLIRNTEKVIEALAMMKRTPALDVALDTIQVLLSHEVGLATDHRLLRRTHELSGMALKLSPKVRRK